MHCLDLLQLCILPEIKIQHCLLKRSMCELITKCCCSHRRLEAAAINYCDKPVTSQILKHNLHNRYYTKDFFPLPLFSKGAIEEIEDLIVNLNKKQLGWKSFCQCLLQERNNQYNMHIAHPAQQGQSTTITSLSTKTQLAFFSCFKLQQCKTDSSYDWYWLKLLLLVIRSHHYR